MKLIFLFSFIFIYNLEQCSSSSQVAPLLPSSKLVMVYGMFRHGERTPEPEQMVLFPKYENKNKEFKPYGPGQLTYYGRRTMYNLGIKLRLRYVDQLFRSFYTEEEEVRMESTKYKRSLISAQLVLRGLYGGYNKARVLRRKWGKYKHLNDTLNLDKENAVKFYYHDQKCMTYMQKLMASLGNPKNELKLKICQNPITQMAINLGVTEKKFQTPLSVWYMNELYKGEKNTGISPPAWYEAIEKDSKKCVDEFVKLAFETKELKQQSGGVYVAMMLNEFQKYINKTDPEPKKQIRLFSAHDTTVAPAVAAVGGPDGYLRRGKPFTVDVPNYGAIILTELRQEKESKKYFIKIYYLNNKYREVPDRLRVVGCDDTKGKRCYLDKYKTLVHDIKISKKKLMSCGKGNTNEE